MENNKLKKGIEDIKNITMTDIEKIRIFDSILNSPKQNQKPVKSPWSFYSLVFIMKENKLVYYVLIPLIIILSSSGVVFASQDSLPDSILYSLKVKVVEPVIGAMTFSPENKAKYEASLATERLVEAEKLANLGKLNKFNEKKINDLLENHTKSLDKALTLIKDTNSNDQQVSNIVTNFNAGMNAHAKILDTISKQDSNKNQLGNDQKISETARDSANSITNTSIRRVNKNEHHDRVDAYKALINSESSAKEASILLKEESQFKTKDSNYNRGFNSKQNND